MPNEILHGALPTIAKSYSFKMDKPINLSEPIVTTFKFLTPFLLILGGLFCFYTEEQGVLLIGLIIAFPYWLIRFLPMKRVQLQGNYLIISNFQKTDKIHLNKIKSMEVGGWSMYVIVINFTEPNKFGSTIQFAAMQNIFGGGITDRVKSILNQIQSSVNKDH
jgi:hypothetical protein